jgi:hypothetical protein
MIPRSKDDVARALANAHFSVEPDLEKGMPL